MDLRGIGYVGVETPDPAAGAAFLTGVVGLMPARAVPGESFGNPAAGTPGPPSGGTGVAPDGTVFLKMDDHQWRIAVHPSSEKRVSYVGFETASAAAFDEAVANVTRRGVHVTAATDEELRSRAVRSMAWFRDPAGNRLEFFWGPILDHKFVSPTGNTFVTGTLGMGHLNWLVADLAANMDFYTEVLGFRLRDYIVIGPGMGVYFLGCTPRHHTIAIGAFGPFDAMHHFLLEVTDVDAVGRTLDRAMDAGVKISATLGRHKNDGMLSFYMQSPLGFEIEIGCDGIQVDEATWSVREFVEGDWWGHRGLSADSMTESVTS